MEQPAVNQVIVDLPDFIPEEYTVRFSICGRSYEASYAEATVDEVLVLMAETQESELVGGARVVARRKVVETFLPKHLVAGEPDQLVSDLKLVPYSSQRGSLDIFTLYNQLTERYRKKDLGAWEEPPTPRPSGLLGRLRSFFVRAKGA